ncbi:Sodium channel protein 60E [Orchesella cincta]|uniref:Sodium channel protein 60E n=1 Tax=Orchesella cincta TaxID=48709 RepID=A0A1D2MKP3_ORCCI|nr:Sodium channel protein 60E [Orchesella cincta]
MYLFKIVERRLFCEPKKMTCGAGWTCLGMIGENPDDGWTSFDNFFKSMLTTFQLITLDYWERLYDLDVDADDPILLTR